MFDIGWTELLVIGIVALIVVGPQDLPGMFRQLGKFMARMRSMARDFQRAMEDAADSAGVGDVAKDLKSVTSAKSLGLDAVEESAKSLLGKDWAEATGNDGTLDPERAEYAERIRNTAAAMAEERKAREAEIEAKAQAAGAQLSGGETAGAAKKPAAKKPAAKTAAAKKPAAKKSATGAAASASASAKKAEKGKA